jgi:hypothetical protein
MLVAGLYGDGSGQLTQDEVADMEYAEYLKSNGIKTTSRESMYNYFKSKDKLTGIALGKIDKQGEIVESFIHDSIEIGADKIWLAKKR